MIEKLNHSIEVLGLGAYFILLLTERIVQMVSGKIIFTKKETKQNLMLAGISICTGSVFLYFQYYILHIAFDHYKLFNWNFNLLLQCIIIFILADFTEYWYHRATHSINVLWAVHIVHHQSRDYNLLIGLRTSILNPISNLFFLLPLILIGVSPVILVFCNTIQEVYNLLLHTYWAEKINYPKLLKYILVSPHDHKLHHAKNQIYIDKNFSRFFVIWDKLFQTYTRNSEKLEIGVVKQLENPTAFKSLFQYFQYLIKISKKKSLHLKIWFWFQRP